MTLPSVRVALLLIACCLCAAESTENDEQEQSNQSNYHLILGWDCVQKPYAWHLHFAKSWRVCSRACNSVKDCQAFTLNGGHCRLFVFNKCSKDVRSCDCDRVIPLYVRRQPGLPPGALCPADFSHGRCGVKFKLARPTADDWDSSMASCSAERGLSIMAEPIDKARYDYLASLHDSWIRRPGDPMSYFLGGRQDSGSPEPRGGWFWSTCRIPIDPSLWQSAQPDNAGGAEHFACTWRQGFPMMNDCPIRAPGIVKGAFCECVSPFDLN